MGNLMWKGWMRCLFDFVDLVGQMRGFVEP